MKTNEKITHRHAYFIGILMFLILSVPGIAGAQFDDELRSATTSAQLEKLLQQYPNNAEEIVPKLENTLVTELRAKPVGERFSIKEIVPKPAGVSGSLSISENGPSEFLYLTEYPEDRTTFATGSFATVEINVRDVLSSEAVPLGDGSIHRFSGGEQKTMKVGNYLFVNEGKKHHRLTFCLVKGQGYVYLRGKGLVITPDGNEVKLGY